MTYGLYLSLTNLNPLKLAGFFILMFQFQSKKLDLLIKCNLFIFATCQ